MFLERFGAALGCQMLVLGRQKLQNITKMAPQIYEKSRLRRGSVGGAFWGGTGPLKNLTISSFWMHSGDNFRQNIQNIRPKRHLKIDAGEVSKNDDKMLKNNTKIDAEIQRASYFSKKAKMHETVVFTIETWFGHAKRHSRPRCGTTAALFE